MREAEQLVGHEFSGDDDLAAALDEIAELGARNVLITPRGGCHALPARIAPSSASRRSAPHLEPISAVGSGDVLLAGFLAARFSGRPPDEALRAAVATGTASVLEAGAGRFDVREVSRLAALVEVRELEPVAGD